MFRRLLAVGDLRVQTKHWRGKRVASMDSQRGDLAKKITAPGKSGWKRIPAKMAGRNYQMRRGMVKFSYGPRETGKPEPGNVGAAIVVFRNNKQWADKAIVPVADEKLHGPLDANTNSIAVIMIAPETISRPTAAAEVKLVGNAESVLTPGLPSDSRP
jgi:hypothetical protein